MTIGLLVSLAREQVASGPVRALIDKTDEAVAAMEDLVKGLLDISRFDSGKVQPQFVPVNLQRLFASIESHEGAAAREKGLSLRFRPTQAAVRSDPLLLEQILRNLVGNAVRYAERGGVLVAARRRGGGLVLQVWDTGVGIAPEHHGAIFEEFMQVGNTSAIAARAWDWAWPSCSVACGCSTTPCSCVRGRAGALACRSSCLSRSLVRWR